MRLLLFIVVICCTISAAHAGEYETLFEKFAEQKPDISKAYSVEGVFLQQPDCVISLDSGVVVFSTPVDSRVFSATFIGKGTVEYTPPIAVERGQMKRFLGTESYSKEVDGLFFCFTDSTMQQIIAGAAPAKLLLLPAHTNDYFDRGMSSVIIEKKYKYLPSPVLYSYTGDETPWFTTMIFPSQGDPAKYTYNSRDFEGVSFGTVINSQYSMNKVINRITSHFPGIRYENGADNENDNEFDEITPLHYDIDCSIAANLNMKVLVKLSATAKQNGLRWVNFSFHEKLFLDSVLLNGKSVEYFQLPENDVFYARLPQPSKQGEQMEFTFKYHGNDVITRMYDYTFMEFSIQWYPTNNGIAKALFDLTFHVDEKYKFVSIGKKTSEKREGDVVTSTWKSDLPVRNVSFNIGAFQIKDIKNESNIPMKLYTMGNSKMRDYVSEDIALSYRFYEKLFGPRPTITEFSATEIPSGHGEAFPGLLHLSWVTFENAANDGSEEAFVAHEVAHQWWPNAVEYKTYRDRWLSEAMAEYSSWMYTQMALKDNDKFFKFLKKFREELIKKRNQALDGKPGAGAIALGHRVNSAGTENDYQLVIYEKGAWMLHMLRNLFLDLKTMKEDGFLNLLADYHRTFAGKEASTNDFRKLVEKHSGEDCSWFFKQWYEGTDIPTYEFAYKTTKTPEGKYKITVRIAQKHVPADFRASVPIKINFGDDKFVRLRAIVTGSQAEFDLPLMPLQPKDVIFNDLESVLCEVKNVDWKE